MNLNDSILNIKEKSTTFLNQLKEKVAGWKKEVEEWKNDMLLVSEEKYSANSELVIFNLVIFFIIFFRTTNQKIPLYFR